METAASLKPVVATRLPEQLFSVAAGRLRYSESGVDESCQFISQDLLRPIELAAFPLVHSVNLLQGKEGQHTDAL